MDIQPPIGLILAELKRGKVIPFFGSGASTSGRPRGVQWNKDDSQFLPTASELARNLAQYVSFPNDEILDLAKVAQYFKVLAGDEVLYDRLHDIFNKDYPIPSLHRFIAKVPAPMLIITTNYDDLIERAFQENNSYYDLVVQTIDPHPRGPLLWYPHGTQEPRLIKPNKLKIDLNTTTVIYKIHGSVDRYDSSHDQYLISEDDYMRFLMQLGRKQILPAIFTESFLKHHFLFLGYSLRDWSVRALFDLLHVNELNHWAIQYEPSALDKRFWEQRGVAVFDGTIEEFLDILERSVGNRGSDK